MFHQIEGLVVNKNITMAHLKWTIKNLLTSFFGLEKLPMRFRPSYFPFTEPSAEVDIGCSIEKGKLIIGWKILRKFTINLFMIKQKSNLADVLNAAFLFVKFIVLCLTIFQIG